MLYLQADRITRVDLGSDPQSDSDVLAFDGLERIDRIDGSSVRNVDGRTGRDVGGELARDERHFTGNDDFGRFVFKRHQVRCGKNVGVRVAS